MCAEGLALRVERTLNATMNAYRLMQTHMLCCHPVVMEWSGSEVLLLMNVHLLYLADSAKHSQWAAAMSSSKAVNVFSD